jgi:hypothetical protein
VRWCARSVTALLLIVGCASAPAEATEYIVLHLYQQVQASDAIVIATVTDARTATVRVDRVLKGEPPRSIRLISYIDSFLRPADRRELVNGARELMFLKRDGESYAPLQTQHGRFPIDNGQPVTYHRLDPRDYQKTIARLVRLQARAERGRNQAIDAYVDALRDAERHVRLWAAAEAPEHVDDPPARLVDAYLELWETDDSELRSRAVNGVIEWKVARVAPIFAAALREGSEDKRSLAARALGGAGDVTFLPQLRTAATSDPSAKVRAAAYDGLAHLLEDEAMPDLLAGAKDESAHVRNAVAYHAFNLTRRIQDTDLTAGVQRLLEMLALDPDEKVRQSVRYLMHQKP